MSELHTPKKLATHPDIIACAVCRRQPGGTAQIIEVHGDSRYEAFFLPTLNIHVLVQDESTESTFGNLFLRSMRSGNYFLMTIMVKGCSFSKSVKRSMSKILRRLNEGDKQFGVTTLPPTKGHLTQEATFNGGEPTPDPPPQQQPPYVYPTVQVEPTPETCQDPHHPDSTAAMAAPSESFVPSWDRTFA